MTATPGWNGNYKWVCPPSLQTKKHTSIGLEQRRVKRKNLAGNGAGRLVGAKQHTGWGFCIVSSVRAAPSPGLVPEHSSSLPNAAAGFPLVVCGVQEKEMRLDWLQLVVVLLLSGLRGSAVPFACKTSDEGPKSGGKSPASDKKVVCSNMELHQVLPADSFPNRTVILWVLVTVKHSHTSAVVIVDL